MKNKLWLLQLPLVILFTSAYWVTDQGLQGGLRNPFLSEKVYPNLQRFVTLFSDPKFHVRGPQKPKNKVVIVAVDNASIDAFGRWPWHRNVVAKLIDSTFDAGAKVVGLDMVFSEPDPRISAELKQFLESKGYSGEMEQFETDHNLGSTIFKHADNLVMGVAYEAICRPGLAFRGRKGDQVDFNPEICPVSPDGIEVATNFPPNFDKFALEGVSLPSTFDLWMTPMWTGLSQLTNIPEYNSSAMHEGYFDAYPDHDHIIRRGQLVVLYNKKVYPSLPMEMARIGLNEKIGMDFTSDHRIRSLRFAQSGREIPVTPTGAMEVNFRGGAESFTYISAKDVMSEGDSVDGGADRKIAGLSKKDLLKDAYVLIGVSALGVFDMRAFPTDPNVAGVEGHANILDNLLSGDMLVPSYRGQSGWIIFAMVVGALLFALAVQKLEAVPALILFILVYAGIGIVDFKVAFNNNISLNTGFMYLEYFTIFFFILSAKYILEERNKKFVRSAFAKYVAPAVVDSILKDPEKLTVGGVKKDLTIMFSDIRSFTTFSERMDAKALAHFLNDYLGIMTKIVFANEGTLDKYIGDAIMAFWGAPLDQPKHALNACKGAIQMIRALNDNKGRWKADFGVDVAIGVGINSGPVNVGNMGSTDNFAYTVIGDHVNLSSRLEGLTKAYGVAILTTRFTFDEIAKAGDALPDHRVLDNVKVKGKKNAVELIQVLERTMATEGLALFQEARKLYVAQRWDEATAKFREASSYLSLSADEPDGPCEVFLERCRDFKAAPPAADWDGSWEMHSK